VLERFRERLPRVMLMVGLESSLMANTGR